MQNVNSRKCLHDECNTVAIFHYEGNKTGIYCQDHALPKMINVQDIRCEFSGCNVLARFNDSGETKGRFCSEHKQKNMENVRNTRCAFDGCKTIPSCNYEGEKPLYCGQHKLDGMICVCWRRMCDGCGLFQVEKHNNYLCSYCNPSSRRKTKELDIKKLLEDNNVQFIHDKVVQNMCCLRYRPDFVIDCNTFFIVIEVDEDAHRHYEQECEVIRMNNIAHSLGLPTKFIRYNPDKRDIMKSEKQKKLLDTVKTLMEQELCEDPTPIYLFY
jgi:hypothetical protein